MLLSAARYAVLSVAGLAALFPIAWLAGTALKTREEYAAEPMGLPGSLHLGNFADVLAYEPMRGYLLNSAIVVGLAVPIVTAASVAAGYALARLWGRAGIVILFAFLFSELVPITIVAIPLLLTVKELQIDAGLVRLVLVYSTALMGFGVLVSRAFFRSMPEELRDAARVDGCTDLQVFRRIMVPLARSPITLIAVIAFIVLWNEYFLGLILLDSAGDRTLPLGLTEFRGRRSTNWPLVSAALVVSTLPTLLLYAIFQRRIADQFSRSTTRA
jgi:ABC-type glycerol-3-phosphate transport system permease component